MSDSSTGAFIKEGGAASGVSTTKEGGKEKYGKEPSFRVLRKRFPGGTTLYRENATGPWGRFRISEDQSKVPCPPNFCLGGIFSIQSMAGV